jgi:hypothetical protein
VISLLGKTVKRSVVARLWSGEACPGVCLCEGEEEEMKQTFWRWRGEGLGSSKLSGPTSTHHGHVKGHIHSTYITM